ncbi:MAG: hypothetical protein M9928_14265 [Anaerolineae bacterium]|nr:hypothetical protein [Anaerolineae bacterium]MCO5193069.1 hypothetical protein [Anaerolineae bacterium]MCO5206195.1 hypothetical protein [Anaerolineae bacterium]
MLWVTKTYTRYRRLLATKTVLSATGIVERQGQVVNVLAVQVARLPV